MGNVLVITNLLTWASLLAPLCSSGPLSPGPWDSPCLSRGGGRPIIMVPLADAMPDLISRTIELLRINDQAKTLVMSIIPSSNRNHLDTQSFLDAADQTTHATDAKLEAARTYPVSMLQETYSLLAHVVTYVHTVRSTGQIHEDSIFRHITAEFSTLEVHIYNLLCSVMVALLGQGADTVDPPIDGYQVSDAFTSSSTLAIDELQRAYVVLGDCARVGDYLRDVYNTMAEATSS